MPKKGLPTEIQGDIVQEIEALLGRQSVRDLDFEAVEIAARRRCVVLGDGSAWIWNTAQELFPQAIQILDRFHAKEHLSKVGKAIYGDSEPGKKWIQRRYDELDEAV